MQTSIPHKSEMSTRRLFFESTHWDSRKSTKTRFSSKDERVTELELSKGTSIYKSFNSTSSCSVAMSSSGQTESLFRPKMCS